MAVCDGGRWCGNAGGLEDFSSAQPIMRVV
jgi:hypothetical protein